MIAAILVGLLYAVLLILLGWTFGQFAADREHRRRRDRERQDELLRSLRQDLDSLQREQQRLAARLNR
jgi:uncharacterized protein YlxW (UPF0749 family)